MTGTTYILNDLFTRRHKYLIGVANNCLKHIRRCDLKAELFSEAYVWAYRNQDKLAPRILTGETEALIVRWMEMQIKWTNSHFRNGFVRSNPHLTDDFDFERLYVDQDNDLELDLEPDHKAELAQLNELASQLTLEQRLLFDLFKAGVNTSGKLRQYYLDNVPMKPPSRTNCHEQLVQLKIALRGLKDNKNSKHN